MSSDRNQSAQLSRRPAWRWCSQAVAAGSFRSKSPPAIRGSGYVVAALEAALWALHTTETFRDGALAAVNLGDDADTTGAIYGQFAGAVYGADGIPAEWLERIVLRERIEALADGLHELATSKESLSASDWPAPRP